MRDLSGAGSVRREAQQSRRTRDRPAIDDLIRALPKGGRGVRTRRRRAMVEHEHPEHPMKSPAKSSLKIRANKRKAKRGAKRRRQRANSGG